MTGILDVPATGESTRSPSRARAADATGAATAVTASVYAAARRTPGDVCTPWSWAPEVAIEGKFSTTHPAIQQALADRRRVLGDDHPDTPTSVNNLAYAYRAVGDLGRAVPLFEQALADRRRVLGDDHPQTKIARENLAAAATQE